MRKNFFNIQRVSYIKMIIIILIWAQREMTVLPVMNGAIIYQIPLADSVWLYVAPYDFLNSNGARFSLNHLMIARQNLNCPVWNFKMLQMKNEHEEFRVTGSCRVICNTIYKAKTPYIPQAIFPQCWTRPHLGGSLGVLGGLVLYLCHPSPFLFWLL